MAGLNPYHFIPLMGNVKRENPEAKERRSEEKLTGVIEYTIKTRSPLFIPNTSNNNAFRFPKENAEGVGTFYDPDKNGEKPEEMHHLQDFFSYHQLDAQDENGKPVYYNDTCFEPVIPGSELRGMIRNIYETLTGSCMSVVNDDITISKRTAEMYEPGILVKTNGKYTLYRAEDCIYRENGDVSAKSYKSDAFTEGEKVTFTIVSGKNGKPLAKDVQAYESGMSGKIGYVIKGEAGPEMNVEKPGRERDCARLKCPKEVRDKCQRDGVCYTKQKHNMHIFVKKNSTVCGVESEMLDTFNVVLESYEGTYKEYKDAFKAFKKDEDGEFPVYFSKVDEAGTLYYLAPACVTREVYRKALEKILKNQGGYMPCEKATELCPGCQLFGMVSTSNSGEARASRLRFADASVINDREDVKEFYEPIVTLRELSSPKLANSEFYMQRPKDAAFWTYDYYVDSQGRVHISGEEAKIAGRKYYWHQLDKKLDKTIKKQARNKTIRPVKSGVSFSGKVFFNDITKEQLDQLLWILSGGKENSQAKTANGYKIGAGKPLGLGSVELNIASVQLRRINPSDLYKIEPYTDLFHSYDDCGFVKDIQKPFMLMTAFDAAKGKDVFYPRVRRAVEDKGYEWFMQLKEYKKMDRKTGRVTGETGKMGQKRKQTSIKLDELYESMPDISNGTFGTGQNQVTPRHNNTPRQRTVDFKPNQEYDAIVGMMDLMGDVEVSVQGIKGVILQKDQKRSRVRLNMGSKIKVQFVKEDNGKKIFCPVKR